MRKQTKKQGKEGNGGKEESKGWGTNRKHKGKTIIKEKERQGMGNGQ